MVNKVNVVNKVNQMPVPPDSRLSPLPTRKPFPRRTPVRAALLRAALPIPSALAGGAGRAGFTFVEILFAVMILGIGFIMVAGIFPVALNQTQANAQETNATTVARGAANYIEHLPYTSTLLFRQDTTSQTAKSDNIVHAFDVVTTTLPNGQNTTPWDSVKGNLILPEDPRYAWVGLWRRPNDPVTGAPSNFAQVIVIAVQCRNHGAYNFDTSSTGDLGYTGTGATAAGTFMPHPVTVRFGSGDSPFSAGNDTVTFSAADNKYIAPDTFLVVVSDGQGSGSNVSTNGSIFRIGSNTSTDPKTLSIVWELKPGNDLKTLPSALVGSAGVLISGRSIKAYVVGQGADPNNTATFTGGAQDIAAYSTYIDVH